MGETKRIRVEESRNGDARVVLVLEGEFDIVNAPQLAALLKDAGGPVALDMERVTFLDSTTVNVIAQARYGGQDVTVIKPSRRVRQVLEMCGLVDLIL